MQEQLQPKNNVIQISKNDWETLLIYRSYLKHFEKQNLQKPGKFQNALDKTKALYLERKQNLIKEAA